MQVKLSSLPDPKDIGSISLSGLYGGLNIHNDPTDLTSTQSPDMCNMWYRDGALRKRWGQKRIYDTDDKIKKDSVWYSRLFNGWFVWLSGSTFYYADPENLSSPKCVYGDRLAMTHDPGDFVAFDEYLFYKAPGVYFRIKIDEYGNPISERIYECYGTFSRDDGDIEGVDGDDYWYVADGMKYKLRYTEVVRPVIAINRNPDGTGGDLYQPENRINPYKEVWFDYDDTSTSYYLPVHGCKVVSVQVDDDTCTEFDDQYGYKTGTVNGVQFGIYNEDVADTAPSFTYLKFDVPLYINESDWTGNDYSTTTSSGGMYGNNIVYSNFDLTYTDSSGETTVMTIVVSKSTGEDAESTLEEYQKYVDIAKFRIARDYSYKLSGRFLISKTDTYVTVVFEVSEIKLTSYDSETTEYTGYGFLAERFTLEEAVDTVDTTTTAELSNKVRIIYCKENDDAFIAIANCEHTIDYGGSDSICMVTGNTPAQPNAIFWTGNDESGVSALYWPMDQYNLVGAYQDPVTALAKYSSYLIILQEHQTSKGTYSIETNSSTSREFIDIAVATINPERGCDLPHSVQLCGNNLVWADSHYGVLYLADTSWANENAIYKISQNIDGSKYRPGLLADLAAASNVESLDDGDRYYLWAGDDLWVWDYTVSSVSDGISTLSWSKHTGFDVASPVSADTSRIILLDSNGNLNEMLEECNTDFGEKFSCWYTSPTQTFGGYYKLRNVIKLILSTASEEGGLFRVYYGGERTSNPAKEMDTALKASMQLRIPKREFPNPIVLKPRALNVHHFYFRVESDGEDGGLSIDNALILYTTMGVSR